MAPAVERGARSRTHLPASAPQRDAVGRLNILLLWTKRERPVRVLLPTVCSTAKNVDEVIKNEIPSFLVRHCHVVIQKAGMKEGHQGAFSLFLECHCNY